MRRLFTMVAAMVLFTTMLPITVATAAEVTIPMRCADQPGKVICVQLQSWAITAMEDGLAVRSADARHGGIASDGSGPWYTRTGTFSIYRKATNPVSNLYHIHMPYFMAFSGGQGIHYSSEYAHSGYKYSHGCVGLKSLTFAKWLYEWAPIGTPVIVVNV